MKNAFGIFGVAAVFFAIIWAIRYVLLSIAVTAGVIFFYKWLKKRLIKEKWKKRYTEKMHASPVGGDSLMLDEEIVSGMYKGPLPYEKIKSREAHKKLIQSWCDNLSSHCEKWVRFSWASGIEDDLILITDGDNRASGKVYFHEELGDPDFLDQPRVACFKGKDLKTGEPVEIDGDIPVRVPLESIRKNLSNDFKKNRKLIKMLEEAADGCRETGAGKIDTDDAGLLDDARAIRVFCELCCRYGFGSATILSDGHTVELRQSEHPDPLPAL